MGWYIRTLNGYIGFKRELIASRGIMNNCEQHCDCVFSKEEIERLVALCDEDGYIVPRGLTREEKRMFILNSVQKEGER